MRVETVLLGQLQDSLRGQVLRFDADRLALEEVIQYAFRELRAMDMKLAEISVGDVVKTILAQQEAAHAEKI